VAAVLRFVQLGGQSLWIDECFTWDMARVGQSMSRADLLENVHGPLYALIVHFWCVLAGGSEAAMRTPSAICGVATVPTLAWLASRWLGRETAGWAAWLAALSPFLIWYSREARPYAMLMLLVCVSSALMLELARAATRRRAATYTLSVATGVLAAPAFGFVLPLHLRWWLADAARRRRRLIQTALVFTLLGVIALPWVPQFLAIWDWNRLHPGHVATSAETPLRGRTTFHLAALPYALFTFAAGYTIGPSTRELRAHPTLQTLRAHTAEIAAVTLLCGGIALIGLAALARRRRLLDAALWLGVPLVVVSWFALSNFKVFHPRYLASAAPLVVMVAAAAFADLRGRTRATLAVLLALVWGVSLANLYGAPAYGKEDVRGAARYVTREARPGERVLAVNTMDLMLYYYRGAAPLDTFWIGFAPDSIKLAHQFDLALAGAPSAWVVLTRPEDLDPEGRFARLVDRRTAPADRMRFEGVQVWHVPGLGPPPHGTSN
jgi:4-amino-4-deoxy-L-arabinose transferase-like glycosyltransferase